MLTNSNEIKQKDEIEALSSIYGTDFHTESLANGRFSIEINEVEKVILEVNFPEGYPSTSPPIYSLSAPWLKGPKRKELATHLDEIYLENIGENIIYLWVERIREFIVDEAIRAEQLTGPSDYNLNEEINHPECQEEEKVASSSSCPEIVSGEIITDRKSHFQPHLASVHSLSEVKSALKKLYENKKIASATHNMYAYRFRGSTPGASPGGVLCQDCDDDGEANAGKRMLHLLQILEAENVLVVVSRWYGGIQLGPDRFKHINNAARQVLEKGGYVAQKKPPKGKKGSKKL